MARYIITSAHKVPKYAINETFELNDYRSRRGVFTDDDRQGNIRYYVSHPTLGCGKGYSTPEIAIREILYDWGCTNVTVRTVE